MILLELCKNFECVSFDSPWFIDQSTKEERLREIMSERINSDCPDCKMRMHYHLHPQGTR